MAVRFVIGRAGSGKTDRCLKSIARGLQEAPMGAPIFWILPRQATFIAERQLTCAQGLLGFCRARVLSFDRLASEVLADCGGAAVPEVTPLGRQMIIGRLLRTNAGQLRFFARVAHQAGLPAQLDRAIGEFEQCGKDPDEVRKLLEELAADGTASAETPALLDKLHDLHLIYREYCLYLGQDRLDPRRRMQQVLDCIERSSLFEGAQVYVDGFGEFDEFQRRVLAKLGRCCERVEISILLDPASPVLTSPQRQGGWDEMGLFHPAEETYRRLWMVLQAEKVPVEAPVLLGENHRSQRPALKAIERSAFDGSGPAGCAGEGLELVLAPDRRAEVEAAARRIRALLAEGLRLRDIAVLARQVDDYHDLIEAAFGEHGIHYFVDRRRSMGHHPLVQFIRCAMEIAIENWPHEAVMTLARCGLSGLKLDEADDLENYILRHRIHQEGWVSAERWKRGRGEPPDAEFERIDRLRRRIVQPLAPFIEMMTAARSAPLPLRQIAAALFELMERFGVRTALGAWADQARQEQQVELADEHEQVWTQVAGLFDQMVELMGDEPMSLEDFHTVLAAGLDSFDLALTPPTVDEVLVGQVDRTRTPSCRAVLLLGLNEGVFPHAHKEDSILCDSERRMLRDRQFEVDHDSQRHLLDETLLGYIAFTRASELVYASRSGSDSKGHELGPSPFWQRLRQMFPDVVEQALPRDGRGDSAGLVATPRQLLTALMRWARCDGACDGGPWPALYDWVARLPEGDGPLSALRGRVWRALGYVNEACLSPEVTGRFFASPLRVSVSQIESFAACPYQHFLRYGLRLEPREEPDPTAIDLGNAYHQALEGLVREMLDRDCDWCTLSAADARTILRRCTERIGHELRGDLMLGNARNKYLLERVEKTLDQVVATQRAAAARGICSTRHVELDFGRGDDGLPPLVIRTPAGGQLHLRGKIDRIDVIERDAAFAILDYKMGPHKLELRDLAHGLALQLLTYLLVVREVGAEKVGATRPVAAFYVKLLREIERVEHPEEGTDPDDPDFPLQGAKMTGVCDRDHVYDFDSELTPGNGSKLFSAYCRKDGSIGSSRDLFSALQIDGLLGYTRRKLGELGDQILKGEVKIAPYRWNTQTPCPRCDFRSVCRFDPSINRYHYVEAIDRAAFLAQVEGGMTNG